MFLRYRSFQGLVLALLVGRVVAAKADVVLLLEDPVNFVGHVTSAGHATLWVDRLCSDDHVQMRSCRAGEIGAVIGRYPHLDSHMDWLAMPPGEFLFAADTPDAIPVHVTQARLDQLQANYRMEYQETFRLDPGPAGWVQLTGEAYRRRVTLIRVRTTPQQDQRLMDWLNARNNRSHFNILYSNCADFVAAMLDVLYPGAVHRNILFDAGMMTPKQVESGLHHYAMHHPELGWQVTVVPQVPGIKRSGDVRGVTEAYLKSWWFLLPLDYLLPYELGAVTTLGLLDHRYSAKSNVEVPDSTFFPPQATASSKHVSAGTED